MKTHPAGGYTILSRSHLQSWSKCPESDALWRIYAHGGNAVRIRTSIKKIQSIGGINGFEVDYKRISLAQELKRVFAQNNMLVHEAFASKRHAFAHEMEYRLMTYIDGKYFPEQEPTGFDPFGKKETWDFMYQKGMISKVDHDHGVANIASKQALIRNIKHISFSHVPEFIESVMVHPMAADWFVETVKRYCEANQIKFDGKSRLYTFDHR